MAKSTAKNFQEAVRTSFAMVTVLFVIEILDLVSPFSLDAFGIVPRTAPGLVGILFSPMLHANFAHLIANAVPLFVLLILLFWDRHYYPVLTLSLIWFASGLGTWLIGRGGAVHIGASSIIFGLVAYLIMAGLLMQSWRSASVALIVFVFFGGIFYGIIPRNTPVSWEGHLSGMIAGFWAARKNHL